MADVNFDAKTNWMLDETVQPADANRWEKGIKDCADAVNENSEELAAQAAEFQQRLNDKADTNLANVASNIDYVIERGTDENGNYYCLYKSGWLEQGGNCAVNSGYGTVTLPKPFSGMDYIINTSINFKTEVQTYKQADSSGADSVTNKSFRIIASNNEDGPITCNVSWRAYGYYDNSVSVFNFPLTADYEDADGNADAILAFKSSTIGGTEIDPSYRYKFDALGGSGAALGFHDDSGENKSVYANLQYDANCYVGTGDFTISADIYIPTPSSANYNIPINVFTLVGYIPNNVYRLFTFGVVVKKWYSDSITTSIGFRYPTSATAQTDLYHQETSTAGLVPTNLFDQWNRIKLERKNGVTKAYWSDNVFDFGDTAYDLKYFDECSQQRALVVPMLEVYNSQATANNINNMFKIKNVKFTRYSTIGA